MLDFSHHPSFGPFETPYEDVVRHCKQPYTSGDRMTQAHESTHQINAELRQKAVGTNANAFYVMEDRAIFFREPSVTIANAVERLPKKSRGPVFALYMVEARRHWNRQPLYLVDEAVAYTNGAIVGADEGLRGWEFEAERAKELTQYAWAVIMAVDDLDPTYPELEKLVAFVNWNATRNPTFGIKLK